MCALGGLETLELACVYRDMSSEIGGGMMTKKQKSGFVRFGWIRLCCIVHNLIAIYTPIPFLAWLACIACMLVLCLSGD